MANDSTPINSFVVHAMNLFITTDLFHPLSPFVFCCGMWSGYEILRIYFSHPPFPFFVRAEHDDRGDVGVAIDDNDDDDSVEQTFCHSGRGVPGRESRIDLRVIGNPSAVNLGKLVSTSSPRDLLLFPSGERWEKKFFASTVFTRRQIWLTFKRSCGIYIHTY